MEMSPQLKTMIANMPEKTGKSLEEWIAILKAKNFAKHGEAMKFLKGEHGVTHGFANTIIQLSKADQAPTDLVAAQYTGKEGLRPIYDRLVEAVNGFGQDVELAPKKTYVSLRAKKQFGLVQPSTKTRVDLGLNLKGTEPGGVAEAAGSWNSMCTHRIRLSSAEEITPEVIDWLRAAYEASR